MKLNLIHLIILQGKC